MFVKMTGKLILLSWLASLSLIIITLVSLQKIPKDLLSLQKSSETLKILDRHGSPIHGGHLQTWNTEDIVPLGRLPDFLLQSFILAEDQRFFSHNGIDWIARGHAFWQNLKSFGIVRGASTITEQVVRMIHPRPRGLWSKWLETWEAIQLDKTTSKEDILQFYLNQVPYARNQRGVVQAARLYFDREIDTLTEKEMLTLTVLVRSPSRLDLYNNKKGIILPLKSLVQRLSNARGWTKDKSEQILQEPLNLQRPRPSVRPYHFVRYLRKNLSELSHHSPIKTTLDLPLQNLVTDLLNERLLSLKDQNVKNGAALIIDHQTGDVLTWATGGHRRQNNDGTYYDAVLIPRQPGSTLKPFLYATALENGWSPSTIIEDSPVDEAVGTGIHIFKNYSRTHYGPVTIREALGNSLNIPAIRAISHVGTSMYLNVLKNLGFHSLRESPEFYGEGLALGNGEVTLLELTRAYSVLANLGQDPGLRILMNDPLIASSQPIFSPEVSSMISHILSDPGARRYEFGPSSLLNLPGQTAIKTGTSTDYRDAWVIGYNDKYVVGIWMGNMDQAPMDGVTGSTGPAVLIRSIFSELNQWRQEKPLALSKKLHRVEVCQKGRQIYRATNNCLSRTDWYRKKDLPTLAKSYIATPKALEITYPTPNLILSLDPRLPRSSQAMSFQLSGYKPDDHVEWWVNGKPVRRRNAKNNSFTWKLIPGNHQLKAQVYRGTVLRWTSKEIKFSVIR